MLMAVGVGLTLINTRAVLEALFGVKSGFVRTPKYAIEGNAAEAHGGEEVQAPERLAAVLRTGLRNVLPLHVLVRRSTTFNYPTLPFLVLFVCGYYWAGFGTLYQEYQDRLRYNRQTPAGIRNAR